MRLTLQLNDSKDILYLMLQNAYSLQKLLLFGRSRLRDFL